MIKFESVKLSEMMSCYAVVAAVPSTVTCGSGTVCVVISVVIVVCFLSNNIEINTIFKLGTYCT